MAEMLNKKTVLRTASEMLTLVFTFKNAARVMVALLSVIFLVACAKENINPKPAAAVTSLKDSVEVLIEHYSSSLRTLTVSATPKDTLIKSDVNFAHTAVMQYADENGTRYNLNLTPTAYSYVRQSKERIEVANELEIPATLVSRKVISDKPYNSGTTLGRDKVEEFTYSDGDVDQVHYGYRYLAIIAGGDTLGTPHIEFGELKLDSIHIEKYGEWTELDKPHRLTTHYSLSFTTKGVSNRETTSSVVMRPYRIKSITDVEQVKTGEPTYKIDWVGCPVTKLNLVQSTPTNKGVVTVTESFDVVFKLTAPEAREQASLDSLFAKTSKGELKYAAIGDTVKHANGFQSLNYSGSYTSRNKGTENGSNVESSATIVASMPVKFSNKWGSVDIKPLEPTFEEGGFVVTSVSQDADYHMFKTVNTIIPKLGDCTLDALDEIVNIKVGKDKPAVPVDSAYVKGGKGDDYDVLKTVYYSDGSKREYPFSYTGHHSASATNFGDKVTSSLNWSASELKDNGTSQVKDNGKVFTSTTRFEVTYVTTNKKSDASNGVESGVFGFAETHPVVVFVDGQTKLTFDERKVVLSGKGAQPAANYTLTVKDGISYKGYTYNMSCGVVFDGAEEADVTSQGLLMMVADQIGDTTYKDEYVWAGNTLTATVTKTIDHTFADDEVETYTKAVTVSMGDLADGRVDAENTSFTVTPSNSEKSDDDKDGVWTITKRVRNYTYDVSNGSVSRQMTNEVVDYVLVFNDGAHSHTFDGKLNVSNADNFGTAYADGDFTVTPLTTTVTAVATGNGAPTLTTKGVTSIYVENKKEITWKLTYTVDEVDGGNVYVDLTFQRLINGQVNKTWKHWGLGGMFGQYKPDVEGIWVTNTKFRDNYSTTEHATDPSVYDLGDEKAYTLDNISKIEDHFSVLFDANADADGNTTREVAGHVNRWSYRYTAVDKEYNHSESIDLVVTIKTTVHNVENGVYTRTIEYQLNGVTVATQTGTVKVTVE
jgi:hypothetical protein